MHPLPRKPPPPADGYKLASVVKVPPKKLHPGQYATNEEEWAVKTFEDEHAWNRQVLPRAHKTSGSTAMKSSNSIELDGTASVKKEVFIRNANDSSFLRRLPVELRSRMYKNVMGGKVIHISRSITGRRIAQATICLRPEDHENIPEDCRVFGAAYINSSEPQTFENRHSRCYGAGEAPHKAINLNLTLVCRQIYRESSLIPFNANRFVLRYAFKVGFWVFSCFLEHLSLYQINSITRLNLHCQVELLEKSEVDLLLRMKGLKSLSLIIRNGLHQIDYTLKGLGFPPNGVLRERLEFDRLRLSQLPLDEARVYMDVVIRRRRRRDTETKEWVEKEEWATTIYNAWLRETEDIMRGSADEFLAIEAAEAKDQNKGSESMGAWIEQLHQLASLK